MFHLCGAQFGSRIPSLRTNICGRVTHDNVRQFKSTNDAVLIVVPFHGKVHEFLTLLNGCQVLCTTFYETHVDRVYGNTVKEDDQDMVVMVEREGAPGRRKGEGGG